jgi:cytochrome b6-f complex iron-sulfur subunit
MSEPNPPASNNPAPETAITSNPPAAAPAPTAVTAVPPKPAPPAKPAPAKPPSGGRRFFLAGLIGSWIAVAWITLSASLLGMVLGTVRFLFPNVLAEPPSTFKAGAVDSYEEGKVEDKYKEVGSWVIEYRDDLNRKIIYALSTTCTHLGCTPNWLEADKKFKCPCHGSGFKITGVNFEGPAPRPLERYAIKKTEDGQLIVDKSRKFQKELGQWDDPESYVLV